MAISSEDVEAIKEELREELRGELKEELREELSPPGRSRRDVLKLGGAALGGAALGSVGGAAGAVGAGDEFLDVGSVTANTYRVAGNWYGGPAAARTELDPNLGAADAGARYEANDTGAEYYWSGSAWSLLPEVGSEFYTVPAGDFAEVFDAMQTHDRVATEPGGTYTHDGTLYEWDGTVEDRHVVVDASGSTFQVDGTLMDIVNTGRFNDRDENLPNIEWLGGYFDGNANPGDLPFLLRGASGNRFDIEAFRATEGGMLLLNEDGGDGSDWCEFNDITVRKTQGLDFALGFVGNRGTSPGSFADPVNSAAGATSFRRNQITLAANIPGDTSTQYGMYCDDARIYDSDVRITLGGGNNGVGLRIKGGWNGSILRMHYELGDGTTDTGVLIDGWGADDENGADATGRPMYAFLSNFSAVGAQIVNNTNSEFYHYRPAFADDAGTSGAGPEVWADNAPMDRFRDAAGGVGQRQLRNQIQIAPDNFDNVEALDIWAPDTERWTSFRDETGTQLSAFSFNTGSNDLNITTFQNHLITGFSAGATPRPKLRFGTIEAEEGYNVESAPPSNPETNAVYFDDGTNTGGGTPGWRWTNDGGATWNDV